MPPMKSLGWFGPHRLNAGDGEADCEREDRGRVHAQREWVAPQVGEPRRYRHFVECEV